MKKPGSKTNTRADKRKLLAIEYCGGYSGAKLAIPYSMMREGSEFNIGQVRFQFINEYTAVRALDRIPDSWLIDLSADVIETVEEELEGADLL